MASCKYMLILPAALVRLSYLVSGVGEGLAHGKLVNLILCIKTECKAEHIGIVMSRGPVVEHVAGGHSLPSWP